MTPSYDDIWAEAAENLVAYMDLLKTGEAQLHEAPLIMSHTLYLVTSMAYYKMNVSLMSDAWYDALCQFLYVNYDLLKTQVRHPEKFLDKEQLQAGTGYAIEFDQPTFEIYNAVGRVLLGRQS
jgi:hypothetical protein